jgi:hypothetical protein
MEEDKYDRFHVNYRGIEHDKQNLRNDIFCVLSDIRKATDEAKIKVRVS